MLKELASPIVAVLVCLAFAGCSPTAHQFVRGPDGQNNVKIKCRARASHKCTMRAEEVCGGYSIIEPLHLDPAGEVEATMTVRCNPAPRVPTLAETQNDAGTSGDAPPVVAPSTNLPSLSGDAGRLP